MRLERPSRTATSRLPAAELAAAAAVPAAAAPAGAPAPASAAAAAPAAAGARASPATPARDGRAPEAAAAPAAADTAWGAYSSPLSLQPRPLPLSAIRGRAGRGRFARPPHASPGDGRFVEPPVVAANGAVPCADPDPCLSLLLGADRVVGVAKRCRNLPRAVPKSLTKFKSLVSRNLHTPLHPAMPLTTRPAIAPPAPGPPPDA